MEDSIDNHHRKKSAISWIFFFPGTSFRLHGASRAQQAQTRLRGVQAFRTCSSGYG